MKKRPLSIVIISIFYFLEPIGNLIQAAYINNIPLFGDQSIVSRLLWSDWIILALFPVVGFGIYMVKKWGWYLFLAFSGLLIFYNIYVYKYLNPNYSLEVVLLFIVITTVISAFFLRKNVYTPYFNPRLRWWETATRYKAPLNTRISTDSGIEPCRALDISETGCFIDYEGTVTLGSSVMLVFDCEGIQISCIGKIVNKRSDANAKYQGYGIMFLAMSPEMKKKLRQLLWYFERMGLEDRADGSKSSETSREISWQDYSAVDQVGFRLKHIFKSAFGLR